MTGEEAYKENLRLHEVLGAAELRFARAVINARDLETRLIIGKADLSLASEVMLSRISMQMASRDYVKSLEYLDEIGFAP